MKYLPLFFLLSSSSIFCAAQVKAPETDFTLRYGKVSWQHEYESDLMSAEILSQLTQRLNSDSRNTEPVIAGNTIRFSVDNDKPNLKKLGVKESKASIIAKVYYKYDVLIDVGDKKYTVTLTDIFLDNKDRTDRISGDISKFICNTSNLTFKTDEFTMRSLGYVHQHLLEKYDLNVELTDLPAKK